MLKGEFWNNTVKETREAIIKNRTLKPLTAIRKVCVELGFVPEAYLRKDYLNEDLVLFSAFLE